MRAATQTVRRIWRHLTRTQARAGWALTLAGVAIYALYDAPLPEAETVQQFCLVVASVAFGAVFLPELSSNLWSIRADEVRGLIPDRKIHELEEALVRAQLEEDEWGDHVVAHALRPLIEIGDSPHRIVGDLTYMAAIHLDQTIALDDGSTMTTHRVETTLKGRRVLPPAGPDGMYWLSIARTDRALRGEFGEESCLFREVVELDPAMTDAEWKAVVTALSSARVVVDGKIVAASTTPPGTDEPLPDGLIRWYVGAADIPATRTPRERRTITLSLDYPMQADNILVVLGSYYTMGHTQVTIRVYDQGRDLDFAFDSFFGSRLGSDVHVSKLPKKDLCTQFNVITDDSTLLWPGSGLLVSWKPEHNPGG